MTNVKKAKEKALERSAKAGENVKPLGQRDPKKVKRAALPRFKDRDLV